MYDYTFGVNGAMAELMVIRLAMKQQCYVTVTLHCEVFVFTTHFSKFLRRLLVKPPNSSLLQKRSPNIINWFTDEKTY